MANTIYMLGQAGSEYVATEESLSFVTGIGSLAEALAQGITTAIAGPVVSGLVGWGLKTLFGSGSDPLLEEIKKELGEVNSNP